MPPLMDPNRCREDLAPARMGWSRVGDHNLMPAHVSHPPELHANLFEAQAIGCWAGRELSAQVLQDQLFGKFALGLRW